MVQGLTGQSSWQRVMDRPAGSLESSFLFSSRSVYPIPILAALLCVAAESWPFELWFAYGKPQWWLQIAGVGILYRVFCNARSIKEVAVVTTNFVVVWLSGTFSWLFVAMHTFGGLPAWMAVVAVVALALALGTYYIASACLWYKLYCSRSVSASWLFAVLWTAAEMARGNWLTGFGWGALGYAHTGGPFSTLAPLLGMYGCGLVAVATAATLSQTGLRLAQRLIVVGGVLFTTFLLLMTGAWTKEAGGMSATLLQGNIPQNEKFDVRTGIFRALDWYGKEITAARTDIVVAPETAIPVLPNELPDQYWDTLNKKILGGQTAALIGIPLGDYIKGYTNSVIALGPDRPIWQYDKHHLVPFGEFIPPMFKWFTRMMNIPLGDFNRGDVAQPPFYWKTQRIGANICYEDLFTEELAKRFANPGTDPTIFANVSNLAWFGDSKAMYQHHNISTMRAIEFERPFLRATNTGITSIINSRGETVASLPPATAGALSYQVEGRSGITPYAWWMARFGLWPYWLLCAFTVLAAGRARMKQKQSGVQPN